MENEIIVSQLNSKLDLAVAAWLDAKAKRSGSKRTAKTYASLIQEFRNTLRSANLDLDSDVTVVALIAQGWAGKGETGLGVGAATFNQRLAVLSSFYTYAKKQRLLMENPLDQLERRPVQSYGKAAPLDLVELKQKLALLDRTTLEGKRDYALLVLALQTGRRLSEIAGLVTGDLEFRSGGKVLVTWRRVKGGKTMSDLLPSAVGQAIKEWLVAFYKAEPGKLVAGTPVWVSFSPRNPGEKISIRTIARICEKRLGISKVHALRHTFAWAMEESGAKVSEIQSRLGHESLATTGRYLAQLKRAENSQAEKLAELFGIS
jgi:integrase/recombinase XerC